MPKSPALTYEKIKRAYYFWKNDKFSRLHPRIFGSKKNIICLLAKEEKDGDHCSIILGAVNKDLSEALEAWTGDQYLEIRSAQERNDVAAGSMADKLQSNLQYLPLWKNRATHYSDDDALYKRLKDGGDFTLRACMSCSGLDYKPPEFPRPISTLVFKNLKSARLIGGLSETYDEYEVILPANSKFKVVEVDHTSRTIYLEEK